MLLRPGHPRRALVAWLAAAAAASLPACSLVQKAPAPIEAPAARITEDELRVRAQESLALGLREYHLGNYAEALRSLKASLDHGLLPKTEQSNARKHLAFIHCVSQREPQCRDEFRKALEIDSGFGLAPAEAGHPIWGPVYRSVRKELAAAAAREPALFARSPRSVAEQLLDKGMASYEAGDFEAAVKLLQSAVKERLRSKDDRVNALKHSAFSLCLLKRYEPCHKEFMRIFEVDPEFDLTTAEAGHPSWGHVFASAKRHARLAKVAAQRSWW